jgi:FKBP-type peptidyl-prolyl cis-trans isomerase FklB
MLFRGLGTQRFGVVLGVVSLVCGFAGMVSAQEGQIGDVPAGQTAQEPAAAQDPAMMQQASYLLGQELYSRYAQLGVNLDVNALILGIQDAAQKKPSAISPQQANEVSMAFGRLMQSMEMKFLQELADKNLKAGQAFLKENSLKPGVKQLENGIQYEVLQTGNGPNPTETDVITAHFVGSFIDGTVFESSVASGKPATFSLTEVIEGWTKTFPRMKVGDKWRVFIPASLAYRERGQAPVIQPNQMLIYELELLEIKPR